MFLSSFYFSNGWPILYSFSRPFDCHFKDYGFLIKSSLFFSFNYRKTCQACRCSRETHAIYHEQLQSVRERLGLKPESSNTSRVDPRQLGYTWVPSGILTSAKIQRYFESLPSEKVPKLGTSGDKWRDKQLAYQLPKQDLAMTYCKNIEEENRASFEDFVSMRNEIALDIGERSLKQGEYHLNY